MKQNDPSSTDKNNEGGFQTYSSPYQNQAYPYPARDEQNLQRPAQPLPTAQAESLPLDGSRTELPQEQPKFVPAQPVERKPKKVIGLGTALSMALVAALVGGGVSAVAVHQMEGTNAHSESVNSLNKAPLAPASNREQGDVERVAAATLPAVVSIRVADDNGVDEGSGSIISSDGLVLTNHHVVANAAQGARMQVTLNNGEAHPAEYIASDPSTDIAVIRVQDVHDLPTLSFGDSSTLKVGQQVVAIGAPLGLSSTVTTGIVSALDRPVRASQQGGESSLINAVQTDAAINPGNSGGPLVDMEGHLVGMNSVIASLSRGEGQAGSIGLGFAIPSNFAKRVADQLVHKGKATQPIIGVQVAQGARVHGALIADVIPDGPAAKAGVKTGEVVTRVNDRPVENADAAIATIRSHEFGETIRLTLENPDTGESREVEVTLTTE